tara:strand:+ start:440 stop:1396 length:957 start_codon:yes stop_codon:yes gene_type:complete
MNNNKNLMFSITREDPSLELYIARTTNATNVLTVASGGCMPLELKYQLPNLNVTAFDFNITQIEHCQEKISTIEKSKLKNLNVECDDPAMLNQCGQFESMFRLLRSLFLEFLSNKKELEYFFSSNSNQLDRHKIIDKWKNNKHWESIFYQVFCDKFVHSIFDESATQNAEPNSYPKYFQKIFLEGFIKKDSNDNPWLHHIFLGKYLANKCLPHIQSNKKININFIHGQLTDVKEISKFNLISLSNIFDWSNDSLVSKWSKYLQKLKSGSYVTIRQLNNSRNLNKYFDEYFDEEKSIAKEFLTKDRSLFYNNFIVYKKK